MKFVYVPTWYNSKVKVEKTYVFVISGMKKQSMIYYSPMVFFWQWIALNKTSILIMFILQQYHTFYFSNCKRAYTTSAVSKGPSLLNSLLCISYRSYLIKTCSLLSLFICAKRAAKILSRCAIAYEMYTIYIQILTLKKTFQLPLLNGGPVFVEGLQRYHYRRGF